MSAAAAITLMPQPMLVVDRDVWLSKEEIVAKTGITNRSVERYAATGKTISRELPQRGRNGKQIRQYLVSSLPQELRAKLIPPVPQVLEMRPVRPSHEIAPLFASVAPEQPGRRISLDPKAERQANERYRVIEPLLNYSHPANKGRYATCRLTDGRAVKTARLLAEYLSETCTVNGKKISQPTLWRWVKLYREGDRNALARKVNSNKGTSTFFRKYPQAAVLASSIWLKPNGSATRAYDAIRRDREMLGIPVDQLPDPKTVYNFCESIPKNATILAQEGLTQYNLRCAPHLERAYVDIPANDTWVADTMLHDVEVRNDCFPDNKSCPIGAPMRLQFTAIMDMRSRKFVGYAWCVAGDWRSIATALRRAVVQYGPCVTFYCDNGADFKKVASGAKRVGNPRRPSLEKREEMHGELTRRGPLAQLGIQAQLCIPYNAQAKTIERAFGTFHGKFDAEFPGYLSGSTATRPDMAILMGAEHRKLAKRGLGDASMLPAASTFIHLAKHWIETSYNAQHKHTGKGMKGNTPDFVFNTLYPKPNRRQADPEVLDMLLFERISRLVRSDAVAMKVGDEQCRFMPALSDPKAWADIHQLNERNVTIAYDPLDLSRVVVLDAHDRKVCELQAQTLTTQSAELAEETNKQIGDMLQMKGRLLKATYGGVHQIHQQTEMAGHKTNLQLLTESAFANVNVDDVLSHKPAPKAVKPAQTAKAPASAFDISASLLEELL